jgi:hypothetical protein
LVAAEKDRWEHGCFLGFSAQERRCWPTPLSTDTSGEVFGTLDSLLIYRRWPLMMAGIN